MIHTLTSIHQAEQGDSKMQDVIEVARANVCDKPKLRGCEEFLAQVDQSDFPIIFLEDCWQNVGTKRKKERNLSIDWHDE